MLLEHREKSLESILSVQEDTARPVCEEPSVVADEDWIEKFYDEITGTQLNSESVREARADEIRFIKKFDVWTVGSRPAKGSGYTVVRGRWVDVNKGDSEKPNYRSRYVGQEIKKGVKTAFVSEFFAAMPPLSSSKFLLILAVTKTFPGIDQIPITIEDKVVLFVDVKRAHFVSAAQRKICVELPKELRREGVDEVGYLNKAMYGTRDAAFCWSMEVVRVFVTKLGFVQGLANPCHFYHHERQIRAGIHGDDVEALGAYDEIVKLKDEIQEEWEIVVRGILGPPGRQGTTTTVRHLNRLITWDNCGITWECDPRHVDLIVNDLGLSKGKSVTSPLVRDPVGAPEDDPDEEVCLDEEEKKQYQSNTMRLGYISHDRPDLQRTVRELAKGMQSPQRHHLTKLKRCARYLKYAPRCVQRLAYQSSIKCIDAYTDSDYAGCIRTRKSTTGVVIMLGTSMSKSTCRGQGVPSLSVGESEYYGLVSGACEALGERSYGLDLGVKLEIKVWMDSTTGAAIGSRQGLGKLKHVDVRFLWVQDYTRRKEISIWKVHTSLNFADILTKAISAMILRAVMIKLGFDFPPGRSSAAYKA